VAVLEGVPYGERRRMDQADWHGYGESRDPVARTRLLRDNARWRCFMGDKGKKDKEKGQKQHAAKDKQEERKKLEKQPKRTA
jgi:hypothetical protein